MNRELLIARILFFNLDNLKREELEELSEDELEAIIEEIKIKMGGDNT